MIYNYNFLVYIKKEAVNHDIKALKNFFNGY